MLNSVVVVALLGFSLLVAASEAFVVPYYASGSTSTKIKTKTATKLYDIPINKVEQQRLSLCGLEFQLEEREDRDTEATNIWLNGDGSVTLGQTDGPPFKDYKGSWSILLSETSTASSSEEVDDDKPFRLTLDRVYEGQPCGKRSNNPNSIDEFDYHVKREFYGNINKIGSDTWDIEGIIHGLDERDNVDCEVGYFALIDTTKDLQDNVRDIEAEISHTMRLEWIKESNDEAKTNNTKKEKKKHNLVKSSRPFIPNNDMIQGPFN